jgi:hypothetical protein
MLFCIVFPQILRNMDQQQTVTIEKSSLQKVAVVVPVAGTFFYLSYVMLFGPCTMSLPGFTVSTPIELTESVDS